MQALPIRLPPGCDLRRELERRVIDASTGGFVMSGIGSLSQASIRFANVDTPTRFVEPLEILTLTGSVTPDGAHLHVSVSTASGRVVGGHLGYDSLVRTTAEILVALVPAWRLTRAVDAATGYAELVVERRENDDAERSRS